MSALFTNESSERLALSPHPSVDVLLDTNDDIIWDKETEEKLIEHIKKTSLFSTILFCSTLLINFILYLIIFIMVERVFIFPANDILYYDHSNPLNYIIFIMECGSFLLVVILITKTVDTDITIMGLIKYLIIWSIITLFGIMYSLLSLPLIYFIMLSDFNDYHNKVYQFIYSNNMNHKLKIISAHHYLSKICCEIHKDVKNNNKNNPEYEQINDYLDEQLLLLSTKDLDEINVDEMYKKVNKIHRDPIFLISIIIYILSGYFSLIRLLFYSNTEILLVTHRWVYWMFWGKLIGEIFVLFCIIIWILFDIKLRKVFIRYTIKDIARSDTYSIEIENDVDVVSVATYQFDIELKRFYDCWRYEFDRRDIRKILNHTFFDLSNIVYEYLYGENKYLIKGKICLEQVDDGPFVNAKYMDIHANHRSNEVAIG